MGPWDVVVPVTSVAVTGGVAVWSKIIEARSKREDRQNARAVDYEGRVWQAKNDALRRLISACRGVKRWTEIYRSQPDAKDVKYNRARLVQTLYNFKHEIGGEDGISEITAYAAEPVRDALDEFLELVEERTRRHWLPLFLLNRYDEELARLRLASRDEDGNLVTDPLTILEAEKRRSKTMDDLAAVDIDCDAVDKLCDLIIDVARKDIQGRY